ncbi:MAG: hypothetical protein AB8I08_08300 [Sandaracinaceae bacterium]
MTRSSLVLACLLLTVTACTVDNRLGRADGGSSGTDDGSTSSGDASRPGGDCTPSPEGTPETCSDGIDNNCNFQFDCSDVACSGVGECPICGLVDTPLGSPLALPDGEGGDDCSSDADCPGEQRCFTFDGIFGTEQECRAPYASTLSFVGFGGATFDSINDITALCVTMEHSWVRDVEIALEAPNGTRVRLQEFLGRDGDELYMGNADDCDDSGSPSPGTGAVYCWSPAATRAPTLEYANSGGALDSTSTCNGDTADVLPPGDYQASDDWSNFLGTPLNGDWTLLITDLWGIDNGYVFDWSIQFDANAVEDCSSPLI